MKLKTDFILKILISLVIINLLTITACGQKGDLVRPLPEDQRANLEPKKSPKSEESQQ